jgi:hypothetical protein
MINCGAAGMSKARPELLIPASNHVLGRGGANHKTTHIIWLRVVPETATTSVTPCNAIIMATDMKLGAC